MIPRPGDWAADCPAVAHVFVAGLTDECEIDGSDGHHLARVRRLRTGEIVTAADGVGSWRPYRVRAVGSGQVTLTAEAEVRVEPVQSPALGVAFALAKGDRPERMTQQLTELGVDRIVPLAAERCVVQWDAARQTRALERLRRIGREAAMQSRRARVPRVDPVAVVGDVARHPALVVGTRDASGANGPGPPPVSVPEWLLVVGPEGGFTPGELDLLSGGVRLAVGPHVLRSETAAVGLAAVLARARDHR
ncbi:MAG TPA: RsmE family RNA methyltransferase [Acidimicrobiia bacterium]|nr:RsmE family RNA methyltransferase [Acidimicrobiia bacterium]